MFILVTFQLFFQKTINNFKLKIDCQSLANLVLYINLHVSVKIHTREKPPVDSILELLIQGKRKTHLFRHL